MTAIPSSSLVMQISIRKCGHFPAHSCTAYVDSIFALPLTSPNLAFRAQLKASVVAILHLCCIYLPLVLQQLQPLTVGQVESKLVYCSTKPNHLNQQLSRSFLLMCKQLKTVQQQITDKMNCYKSFDFGCELC